MPLLDMNTLGTFALCLCRKFNPESTRKVLRTQIKRIRKTRHGYAKPVNGEGNAEDS